ncbi:hypothetical protein BKD26_15895 [Streptomyces sp. CB03238]|nr:hypothetical protein BKD26_15895 [Streptomyces sp. CB03238]
MSGLVALLLAAASGCAADAAQPEAPPSAVSSAGAAEATAPPLPELASRLQEHVAAVWPRTSRIWPGADFTRHVLLVSDGRGAWAVDKDGKREVPLADLAKGGVTVPPNEGGFGAVTWDGRRGIIVRPARTAGVDPTGFDTADVAGRTFGLATHEQFHTYVQQDKKGGWVWESLRALEEKAEGGEDTRAQHYPTRTEPRMYRAMVYNSLLAAYKEPAERRKHLAAAAHWQRTWAAKYPDEAKAQPMLDALEGSARYFESMAVAMALVEDPDDPAQVRGRLTGTLKPLRAVNKNFEPYAVGASALFTADAMGLNARQALVEEPVTPQDVVLKGVVPAAQSMPPDVKRGIEESAAASDRKLAPDIEPFVAGMNDKSKWILLAPLSAAISTLGGSGFYTTDEVPLTIVPKARLHFRLRGGNLDIDGVTVAEVPMEGQIYFGTPLDPRDRTVSLKGRTLTLTSPSLKGTFTVTSKTDEGQRFLYAQEP